MAFQLPRPVTGDVDAYRAQLHQMVDEDGDCHVSEAELRCHDEARTPYPEDAVKDGSLERIVAVFETVRRRCGGNPIPIACCYRTPEHNREVGGGEHSQHLLGRAMDLHTPSRMTASEFRNIVREIAENDHRIGGLGLYDWGVHVDVRDRKADGDYAFWDRRGKG